MFILHRQSYTPISVKVALGIIVLWSLKAIVWWSLRQSLIALYSALQWPNPKATFIEIGVCSTRLSSLESPDIEAIWLRIPVNSSVFIVGTVYRPPSRKLEKLWIKRRNVVIIGALNYDRSSSNWRFIVLHFWPKITRFFVSIRLHGNQRQANQGN